MSSQTPGGDPPPDPDTPPTRPPDPVVPDPGAETARFPLEPTPSSDQSPSTDPAPPLVPPSPPPAGIISAEPVGWAGPGGETPGGAPADGPVVAWAAPPAAQAAIPVGEGLVISGVFSRVVAYSVDLLLLGAINVIVSSVLGLYDRDRDETVALIASGILVGVDFLYFVGLWTSGLRATLGMRLLRLRVLNAADASTISINDALLRWLALTGAISILALVPGIGRYVGLISLVWLLALLLTTATNPLRQGLHDRWARSVVVQPAPGGSGAAVVTCLVLIVVVGVVLPIAFLAVAGDQLEEILSQIGESI